MPMTQINLRQKKEKKAIAPKQTHTHKKPLRDKKKKRKKEKKSNAETKRQTKKSKFYTL